MHARIPHNGFNPYTPKSDQFQISPCSLTGKIISHIMKNLAFIAYTAGRWLYYQFSLHHVCIFSLEGWENVRFELGSESVKQK